MRGYFKSQWCMLAIYSISLSVLFVSPYEDEENNSGGGCRAYKDKVSDRSFIRLSLICAYHRPDSEPYVDLCPSYFSDFY